MVEETKQNELITIHTVLPISFKNRKLAINKSWDQIIERGILSFERDDLHSCNNDKETA